MRRVAIIGAAGYVGLELARQLRSVEVEVTAVARENGRFLLRDFGVHLVPPNGLRALGAMDVIVNLAYPTSGSAVGYPIRNREILDQINILMGHRTRLIHVSTQAVFGLALDRPIVVGPVAQVRDFPYVEAKIELENLLVKRFSTNNIEIVRLGNVWGPGSGAWTVPLVNNVLFGEPVGIEGVDGYCNATDVANAASYLVHLIERDELRGISFHHLAEMSSYRWGKWIDRIEAALGQAAVRVPPTGSGAGSLRQEVRQAISPVMPAALYRNFVGGRSSGSWLRTVSRAMGEERFEAIKSGLKRSVNSLPTGHDLGAAELRFLDILSCQTQFETCILDGWCPPTDLEASWSRIEQWMIAAGYTVRGAEQF